MKCAETLPLLELMADNELPVEQAAQIVEHLKDCNGCQSEWDSLLDLRNRVRAFADAIPIPEGLSAGIHRNLEGEMQPPRILYRRSAWLSAALAAAVVALMLMVPAILGPQKQANNGAITMMQLVAVSSPRERQAAGPAKPAAPDLAALSRETGFTVVPVDLRGWRLTGAATARPPHTDDTVALLTYTRVSESGRSDEITCLQTKAGCVQWQGLNEHLIDGRKICCGEVADMSVVYWPESGRDVVLVSALPQDELLDLAAGS